MEQGWIKLNRKILDNPIIGRANYLALWVILLLKANHQEKKFMWNSDCIIIREGQLITGRKELCAMSGIPESTIEDILKYLERQHQIQQQKTTKYRLITIVNWKTYQKPDIVSDNKATTKQQQSDTNKNVIMNKNEKKDTSEQSSDWSLEEKLEEMETNKGSYLDIISTLIREKEINIENSKQLSVVIRRYAKIAKELEVYGMDRIFKVIDEIKLENKKGAKRGFTIDWSLETVLKKLTK